MLREVWHVFGETWGNARPFSWQYVLATDEEISRHCLDLLQYRESAPTIWAVPIEWPTEYEM